MSVVQGLLLAAFDITHGASLKLSYPENVPGYPDSFFSEVMLPEGAHHNEVSHTTFFLSPGRIATAVTSQTEPPVVAAAKDLLSSAAGNSKDSVTVPSSTPTELLRGVNVIRTRLTHSRRRGADVKALALVCKHSWADALRPLLVAGLEELFDAAAAFDDKAEGDRTAADAEAEQASLRRVLASLFDRLNAPDVVTAVAAVPRYTRIQRAILRGLLPVHGKSLGTVARSVGNGFDVPWEDYSSVQSSSTDNRKRYWYWDIDIPWKDGVTGHMRVPLFAEPSVAHSASLLSLLKRYGEGILALYNAVLLEKRVLFLGSRGVPAGEVAEAVLACCHFICPPFPGIASNLLARVFPYAGLGDLSFANGPRGYIAGVTNPIFESKRSMYDVLCIVGHDTWDGRPMTAAPSTAVSGTGAHHHHHHQHNTASNACAGAVPGTLLRFRFEDGVAADATDTNDDGGATGKASGVDEDGDGAPTPAFRSISLSSTPTPSPTSQAEATTSGVPTTASSDAADVISPAALVPSHVLSPAEAAPATSDDKLASQPQQQHAPLRHARTPAAALGLAPASASASSAAGMALVSALQASKAAIEAVEGAIASANANIAQKAQAVNKATVSAVGGTSAPTAAEKEARLSRVIIHNPTLFALPLPPSSSKSGAASVGEPSATTQHEVSGSETAAISAAANHNTAAPTPSGAVHSARPSLAGSLAASTGNAPATSVTGASAYHSAAAASLAWRDLDRAFYARIAAAGSGPATAAVPSRSAKGEAWIRSAFESYTASLISLAQAQEQQEAAPATAATAATEAVTSPNVQAAASGLTAASGSATSTTPSVAASSSTASTAAGRAFVLSANAPRLWALRQTANYGTYKTEVHAEAAAADAANIDYDGIRGLLATLRTQGKLSGAVFTRLRGPQPWQLSEAETDGDGLASLDYYDALQLRSERYAKQHSLGNKAAQMSTAAELYTNLAAALSHPDALLFALSLCPESSGGLHPIAAGLLHNEPAVRAAAARILARFEAHPWPPVRRAVTANLNYVLAAAYQRHAALAKVTASSDDVR